MGQFYSTHRKWNANYLLFQYYSFFDFQINISTDLVSSNYSTSKILIEVKFFIRNFIPICYVLSFHPFSPFCLACSLFLQIVLVLIFVPITYKKAKLSCYTWVNLSMHIIRQCYDNMILFYMWICITFLCEFEYWCLFSNFIFKKIYFDLFFYSSFCNVLLSRYSSELNNSMKLLIISHPANY